MSIIGTRTLSAVLTRDEWAACAPAIKAESRRKSPRWTLQDVADYGTGYVHLSFTLSGSYWHDLNNVFGAYVPNWEV